MRAIDEALALLPANARVVDLGAGGRRITPEITTVDGDAQTSPDVLADLHSVPLPSGTFDGAFCTGTLEHVRDPLKVGRELVRLLKPGGLAYVDVPLMQGFHGDPDDFRRWTEAGLSQFAEELGLDVVQSGVHIGPGSGLVWVAREYVRIIVGGFPGKVAGAGMAVLLRPLLWLDAWAARRPDAHRIASAVYVIARKPDGAPSGADDVPTNVRGRGSLARGGRVAEQRRRAGVRSR